MCEILNKSDIDFILESLNYTKLKFENYEYPSYEIKQKRIDDVTKVINKVHKLKATI